MRRVCSVVVLALVTLSTGALVTHRVAYVATHGVSMNPLYYQGDLVVVARARAYHVGEIVAYRDVGPRLVVLHRIVGGNPTHGFLMKGDNNQSLDPVRPIGAEIIGRAVLHVPKAGVWLTYCTDPIVLAIAAFLVFAGFGTSERGRRKRKRVIVTSHAAIRRHDVKQLRCLPAPLRTAAVVMSSAALLGAAFSAVAWTTSTHAVATRITTPGRSVVFSYSATVRQSPAYDTTSVTSPDPIFRKLTDTVDIHFHYRGHPGRVSVRAILSNLAGWHATVPLAGSVTFAGHSYDGTVRLRLAALDARAQAAARSTGLPAGAVTVTIEPTFSSGAGGSFTPRLPLTLSPLQLSLAGTPGSLTATDPRRISQQHRVTRFLELAGHRVTVSAARLATSLFTLASLLTLAALAAFGASNRGETEGPRIRRRHAADLVATQPITTVPGRPLVDVDSFLTLRRVADRYGLLVLHWARSGVETFVVHDDAATYRYRTGTHSATDKQVASCDVPDAEPADSDR